MASSGRDTTRPLLGDRFAQLGASHAYLSGARAVARQRILDEVLPSATLGEVPCLCGAAPPADLTLATIDRWGLPARNVICTACGLIRLTPRWSPETYARIYAGYYWALATGAEELTR